jgi:hypothetical protein
MFAGGDTPHQAEEGVMRGRVAPSLVTGFGAAVVLTAAISAQERSAPPGAVIVRPVQVREVPVNRPAPPPLHDQRPSFGIERPIDPGFISRPVPRPQPRVTSSRASIRRHGRSRHYSFKPRFNVGHGVVVGFPILYPYAYPYDPFSPASGLSSYSVAPPSPNTYSNVSSVPATSSSVSAESPLPATISCAASAPCGGVSFDLTPASAQVYVEGMFAGIADEFSATSAPLVLAPGTHYIEIRLAGYRTASFDVIIAAGEVTPYEGTLERLRLRTP